MSTPDDFNEIEEMLADLPMREPSEMLDHRVQATLQTQTRAGFPWLAIAAAILIAGAVTLSIVFNSVPPAADAPPVAHEMEDPAGDEPLIQPVNSQPETLNLLWTRDVVEENRMTPTGEPYRAIVRETIDHRAWSDPESGESGSLCVPREELIVLKQNPF